MQSFMIVIIFFLLNVVGTFNLHSFGDKIHSKDEWKLMPNAKMMKNFILEFDPNMVWQQIGGSISNPYDLLKGNWLEISFKPYMEEISAVDLEKKKALKTLMLSFLKIL